MKKADFTICNKFNEKYYLVNTLFGEIDEIDYDIYIKYISEVDKIQEYYKKLLFARHHLQSNESSQFDMFYKLYREYKMDSKLPVRFYIPLTQSCNLSCTYCFQKGDEKKADLTSENLDKIFISILNIISILNHKNYVVVLYGGEPLLSKNSKNIAKIFEFCKKNNIGIQIITNGININHYLTFLEENLSNIINLTITIDGPEHIHDKFRLQKNREGSYKFIKKNIELLEKKNIPYLIRVNMTKELLNLYLSSEFEFFNDKILIDRVKYDDKTEMCSLLDIWKLINKNPKLIKNIKINIINYFYYLINNLNSYPLFEFCDSSHIFLYSLDGTSVYSCNEKEVQDKCIGSYGKNTFIHLEQIYSIKYDKICSQCKVLPLCGGGCFFMREEENNFELCYFYKEIIELINYEIKNIVEE